MMSLLAELGLFDYCLTTNMAALTGFSQHLSKLRIDALACCFHSAAMKLIFHTLMLATVGLVAFVTCARAQVEPVTNAVPLDAATMQRIYDGNGLVQCI